MGYRERDGAWGSAFSVIPLWDSRGRSPYLVFGNGSRELVWPNLVNSKLTTFWLLAWNAYGPRKNAGVLTTDQQNVVWLGTAMEDQQDASGLLYRRNRYYNPAAGRFTQEDPIGLAGGINLYGFANGDPVSYSDPYGLSAQSGCPPLCSGLNPRHLELEIQQAQSGKASVLALGELVRGGRVRATIARHESTIAGAAAANGVDPALIKGIIFEEQTHQTPFEGALEARGEGSTVGLGQMTVGAHGTRRQLLNPTYNINAMGRHLGALQADGLIDPKRPVASLATKYNCGSCTSISAYGERVEKFHQQFSSP